MAEISSAILVPLTNHSRVLHQEANDEAETQVGGLRLVAAGNAFGRSRRASFADVGDAEIIREYTAKRQSDRDSAACVSIAHAVTTRMLISARLRGMSKRSDRDEMDSCLCIGADIFRGECRPNIRGEFATVFLKSLRAVFDRVADIFGRHMVEQEGLGAVDERPLELVECADFDLDGLRAATVADGLDRALE